MTGPLQPGEFRGPRYWWPTWRCQWHMWLGHTITGAPPDPWYLLRCSCGATIKVPH